ncbi:MAG: transglutaminase, partial [Spirochaetaceae bacterium]|nr:transglutaminase [Spirochaetaceae bacterium]
KATVNAQFSTEKEILAFTVRPELDEIDYKDNNPDLDKRLVEILHTVDVVMNIRTDFELK